MRSKNNDIIIAFIILFSLFSFVVYLISKYSQAGYFLSIYQNFDLLTWILLSFLILLGIVVTIESERRKTEYWKIGILLILLCNLTVVLTPYLAGYTFSSSSDQLTHIGFVKDILLNGYINSAFDLNVYPIIPILTAEICQLTGLPLIVLINFIGPVFYILFVIYTYVFSKSLTTKQTAVFALIVSSTLLVYYYNQFFPFGFTLVTFPLIFWLFYKNLEKRRPEWTILILVFVIILTFMHPLAAIIFTIALFLYELMIGLMKLKNFSALLNRLKYFPERFYGLKNGKNDFSVNVPSKFFLELLNRIKDRKVPFSITIPYILLIIVIFWISQIGWLWHSSVMSIADWLDFQLMTVPMTKTASIGFSKLGLNLLDILKLIFFLYGPIFIYTLLSVFFIIKTIFKGDIYSFKNKFLWVFCLILSFFILLSVIDMLMPLTYTINSGRLIFLLYAMLPISVGLAFTKILNFKSIKKFKLNKKVIYLSISLIIGLCGLVSVLTLYPSSLIYQTNYAVSQSETAGAYWMMNNEYNNTKIIGINFADMFRFENAFVGTLNTKYHEQSQVYPQDHFNYTQYNNLGDMYTENQYMMIEPNNLISLYQGMYKKLNRFDNEDFKKLNNDQTTNCVYENGQMQIWYIKANGVS